MRKFFKKAAMIGAALLSLSTVSPFFTVSVGAQAEQVLNLVTTSEPPTVDPALASDSSSGAIIKNVFEGLTTIKENKAVPGVAESWEMSEDSLVYTFKLRESKWSNGEPVTAGDFEYAWKRVLNPETASEYASLLYIIEGAQAYNTGEGKEEEVAIKAIDDQTLEVKLTAPVAYFPELIAHYTFMPVHKATVESDENWAMEAGDSYVVNGPFVLSEWNHSSDYVLTKNPNYWDAENVSLETVNVQMVESEATANAMFQNGDIDYLGSPYQTVSLDAIDSYKADGRLNVADFAAIYWYKINTTDEVLGNANVRKALALAIDRNGLVTNITKGEQQPALGYVPATIAGFEEDRGYFADADFEKAKEYLAKGLEELGMKDPSELTVNISINTSEAHSAIAQYIQEGWAKNLGINVNIDNSEWQVYLDKLNVLDYQIGRLGWIADYNDASSFLSMYDTAENGNNDTGWSNEAFTKLLKDAELETDAAKRTELLKQAEAVMIDEMPVIPIYYYTNLSVKKDNVKNMGADGLGNVPLKSVVVE
ncbi:MULTISPECIES: peptide ABC transporter substrate-binding protein [unclassified Facklamia]|uniref:peptide ABC transporter substrate-binding protein n=1 Tax=Aerococcaceae TaxID=186827 RepID=UPI0013B823C9|nr:MULTISPECIES: peptide ABC transporter substrate-binding protein [unclassified Facklamia]NEW64541.1 peptide ABC transporter substrate-binding protein [Facklamia sp. 252]NEW67748.1 peptide ABC transporter substrate-binding protein [Facklamia sp. 253]QQD65724.1 peptide ABC transporter substrate-binding protein [Aerococcaceae bacterium zg-252]